VRLRFDVLTYVAGNAYLAVTTPPLQPRPGQPIVSGTIY